MENETTPAESFATPLPSTEPEFKEFGSDAQLTSLYVALGMARAEFEAVEKNRISGKGTTKEFAYADLDASLSATVPALSRNGLVVLQPLTMRDGRATLRTIIAHKDGGRLMAMFDVPLPADGDVQTFGKNVTYSRKYQYNALVCIAADQDLDEAGDSQQSFRNQAPKAEEPRRAPQTPQTQAKPAARVEGPKAQAGSSTAATTSAPAGTPKATGGSLSGSGSVASPANSAPAGEPPKAQTGAPSSTQPSSAPSPSTPHSNETSSQPSAAPSGTPLTKEQQGEVYAMYAKLDIAPPRIGAHLTALMNRLGLAGKVTQETHGRVMDALRAELPAGGA